jgi:hypothetical protein
MYLVPNRQLVVALEPSLRMAGPNILHLRDMSTTTTARLGFLSGNDLLNLDSRCPTELKCLRLVQCSVPLTTTLLALHSYVCCLFMGIFMAVDMLGKRMLMQAIPRK